MGPAVRALRWAGLQRDGLALRADEELGPGGVGFLAQGVRRSGCDDRRHHRYAQCLSQALGPVSGPGDVGAVGGDRYLEEGVPLRGVCLVPFVGVPMSAMMMSLLKKSFCSVISGRVRPSWAALALARASADSSMHRTPLMIPIHGSCVDEPEVPEGVVDGLGLDSASVVDFPQEVGAGLEGGGVLVYMCHAVVHLRHGLCEKVDCDGCGPDGGGPSRSYLIRMIALSSCPELLGPVGLLPQQSCEALGCVDGCHGGVRFLSDD